MISITEKLHKILCLFGFHDWTSVGDADWSEVYCCYCLVIGSWYGYTTISVPHIYYKEVSN